MKEIITEIEIQSPVKKVWETFIANNTWSSWNPFIIRSEGQLKTGQRITNTMAMPGRKPMTFRPTILSVDPNKELRWLGHLLIPGLFDGEHYFLFEESAKGTRFVHGEKFTGLLLFTVNMEDIRRSFVALNEALKKRVEVG